MPDDVWLLHESACKAGARTYTDPQSGFQVFTRLGLLERGRCCGAGCRHCPFHHASIPTADRPSRIQQPAWLNNRRPSTQNTCGLFWSGGKDSYLAYRSLQRSGDHDLVLVTTFDQVSGWIAHQDISIAAVVDHARDLEVPLLGVPLHSGRSYMDHIAEGLELAPTIQSLAFGDLHLEHIREWRERVFADDLRTQHLALKFPVWQVAYDELLNELLESGVECRLSAVTVPDTGIRIGDQFDRAFVSRLPASVDAFGERGEFHTEIAFRVPKATGDVSKR